METPSIDIQNIRAKYNNSEDPYLLEEKLPTTNPFTLFDIWFRDVASKADLTFEEINAVSLSTVGKDLRPSSRMVLLKAYTPTGFSFFTNYNSRKGKQLDENPNAAMLFYWPKVNRQVRVEGVVEKLPDEMAVAYWNSRPLASRIGSKASIQSEIVPNRQFLEDKKTELTEMADREGSDTITKPHSWGGFHLIPQYFEFWQGQSDRLHDRIVFERDTDIWLLKRLSP
uniref:pyridoxal 5'-phosphate synthase n=1 Tax=Caenorhabditis tropicalis TaxID=1561998 RepID=A0A1I7U3B6_9PELO